MDTLEDIVAQPSAASGSGSAIGRRSASPPFVCSNPNCPVSSPLQIVFIFIVFFCLFLSLSFLLSFIHNTSLILQIYHQEREQQQPDNINRPPTPMFEQIHEMMDNVYDHLYACIDEHADADLEIHVVIRRHQ
jgi:hypothetical protein